MEPLEPKLEYFQDCLTGFALSESALRGYCKTHIGKAKCTLQDSLYCILECISQNDAYSVRVKGWRYTVIEHACPENPACNALLKKCLNCLPEAGKLNRDLFLRAIYLNNSWEFAKLFLRSWMQPLSGFEELDAFCLLVLVENSSPLYQGHLFLDESAPQRRAFYQGYLRQLRKLAEACFQAEIQQITKDERDTCLQCIINVLAFIPEDGVDQVIDRILQIQGTKNRDIDTKKRIHLKTTMQEFQQKVEDFILRIPHEETQTKETVEHSRRNITEEDCGVEVETEQNTNDREQPRHPLLEDTFQEITEDNLRCIQSLIYLLGRKMNSVTNDSVSSLLKALKLTDGQCHVMPYSHYETLRKGEGSKKSLQDLLSKEVESTNSKVCHLTLLIIEGLLRTFCENQISKIHSNVKREFPREKLCFSAVESDICLAEGLASDKIKFNHDCKESTDCSAFLSVVTCKRSAKCKLTPYTMFKHVKPQACLDKEWEFAKLFMEPYMHKCLKFEDSDAFCLLTILSNVKMSDVDESCFDKLLEKLYKVKNTAFKILHDTDTDMSNEATDVFLQDINFILENSGMPDARRALKQIQCFRTRTKTFPFEIRLDLSMKKKVKEVRNKTMHSADMTINEQEVNVRIDDILQFLRSVYNSHPRDYVEKAIDDVQQLLTCDFRVSLEDGKQFYNEEVATVKRNMHYKRDKTCQNIEKMGKAFGILTSGTKTHASNCNGNKQERKEVLERKWLLDKVFVKGDRQKTTTREAEEKYPEDSLGHLITITTSTMPNQSKGQQLYRHMRLILQIQQGNKRALEEEDISFTKRLKSSKIAGPGEQRYPTQPLSASTSKRDKGDKGETVKEELSKLKSPNASPTGK